MNASSLSNYTGTAPDSNQVIHDLRAPLTIALGYLDELRIVKSDLLAQLSTEEGRAKYPLMAKDVDSEMSLCLEAIRDSLEELDSMMVELRGKI